MASKSKLPTELAQAVMAYEKVPWPMIIATAKESGENRAQFIAHISHTLGSQQFQDTLPLLFVDIRVLAPEVADIILAEPENSCKGAP